MKINWKVRFKNPAFWVQIAVSVLAPILSYFGLKWSDLTTWAAVGDVLWQAIQNPVVVVAVLVGIYNTCIDPTTQGLSDSVRALGYNTPAK